MLKLHAQAKYSGYVYRYNFFSIFKISKVGYVECHVVRMLHEGKVRQQNIFPLFYNKNLTDNADNASCDNQTIVSWLSFSDDVINDDMVVKRGRMTT